MGAGKEKAISSNGVGTERKTTLPVTPGCPTWMRPFQVDLPLECGQMAWKTNMSKGKSGFS